MLSLIVEHGHMYSIYVLKYMSLCVCARAIIFYSLPPDTEVLQQLESSLSHLFQHICVISKAGKMKYKI